MPTLSCGKSDAGGLRGSNDPWDVVGDVRSTDEDLDRRRWCAEDFGNEISPLPSDICPAISKNCLDVGAASVPPKAHFTSLLFKSFWR